MSKPKSVAEFIASLRADIGKTASDLNIFNKLGVSADNWCVDYGQLKFDQFDIRKYLYNTGARDVGTVSQAFFDKGRLLSREEVPKVGDIMIITNSPGSTSWRTDKYGFYLPELDHFTIITSLDKNTADGGYVIRAIGGNQGNNDIYYSEVQETDWPFSRQACYCSVDWDAILSGGGPSAKSDTIDVSQWNGDINWSKVKAAGVKNVIIKIGEGDVASQKDPKFETNYKGAKAAGLKVGGYWVCYCGDDAVFEDYEKDAQLEAEICLGIIKGKSFDLPIYHDLEVKSTQTAKIHNATKMFCQTMVKGGYKAGVYASESFYNAYLKPSDLSGYSLWVAKWGSSKPSIDCDLWQFTEDGSLDGISTDVDFDKWLSTPPTAETVNVKWRVMGIGYDNRVGQVKDVQRILHMCSYKGKDGKELAVDGNYGVNTAYAVSCWQQKHGRKATGIMAKADILDLLSSD